MQSVALTWQPDPKVQKQALDDPFDKIVKDIALLCFSFFGDKALYRLRLVSQKWKKLTGDVELWKSRCINRFGLYNINPSASLDRVYYQRMAKLQKQDTDNFQKALDMFPARHATDADIEALFKQFPLNNHFCFTQTHHWGDFTDKLVMEVFARMKHLREFSIKEVNSFSTLKKESIKAIVDSVTQLRTLELSVSFSVPWYDSLVDFAGACPKLSHVDVRCLTNFPENDSPSTNFAEILVNNCPHLKTLSLWNLHLSKLSIEKLSSLKKLRSLVLQKFPYKNLNFLTTTLPYIQNLAVFEINIKMPESEGLKKLLLVLGEKKNLNTLRLGPCALFKSEDLLNLIKTLPNLTLLTLVDLAKDQKAPFLSALLNLSNNPLNRLKLVRDIDPDACEGNLTFEH